MLVLRRACSLFLFSNYHIVSEGKVDFYYIIIGKLEKKNHYNKIGE
jgi:hypothetical protein